MTKEALIIKDKRKEESTEEIHPPDNQFLAMVERLSIRPDIPVEKIQQIMDMQEHILDRNAKQAFNAAMVRAQSKIKAIPRDAKNEQTQSHYSRHETIIKYAAPIYTAEGFSLSFYEGDTTKENHIRVMCDVMHEEGHTVTRHIDVALDQSGIKGNVNKTLIHGEGSSFSYGKRYLTCMIFNIPTGDDNDGNNSVVYISEVQAKEITAIIKKKNVDKKLFLEYMKVEKVEDIPESKFKIAIKALQIAKGQEPKKIKCANTGQEIDEKECEECPKRNGCPMGGGLI